MGIVDGIHKHGFRKWYERQLIEGHVWLVTMVLALIVMASGFELSSVRRGAFDLVLDTLLVIVGASLSWLSWRRYASAMLLAEHIGHQAVCPRCERYGFKAMPPAESGSPGRPLQLVASCRGCGHRWPIETP